MEIQRTRLIRFTWPGENSIHKNNDADGKLQKVSGRCIIIYLVTITYLALELPRKSVKRSSWKTLSYCCFGSVLTQLHYKLDYLLPYNADIYYDTNKC